MFVIYQLSSKGDPLFIAQYRDRGEAEARLHRLGNSGLYLLREE